MSWYALLVTFLLLVKHGEPAKTKTKIINKNNEIRSITSGTSFGECLGYCRKSINITNAPLQLIILKEPNWEQANYPIVQRRFSFTLAQWRKLLLVIDASKFQMLDDRVSCPDCTDGGAEWIQIDWLNKSKLVTFEYGKLVNSIDELIKSLRSLKEKVVKRN